MGSEKRAVKWTLVIIGLIGMAVLGIGIWNFSFPPKFQTITDGFIRIKLGISPKLTITTGVLMLFLAIGLCYYELEDGKHPRMIGILLIIILAISLAGMSIAIRDERHLIQEEKELLDKEEFYFDKSLFEEPPFKEIQMRFIILACTNAIAIFFQLIALASSICLVRSI